MLEATKRYLKEQASQDDDDNVSIYSADEALCEMLGLVSINSFPVEDELPVVVPPAEHARDLMVSDKAIQAVVQKHSLHEIYQRDSVVVFPPELSVPAVLMRRWTDELVWGQNSLVHRTYETIGQNRTLTRLENFVDHHDEWRELCHDYLRRCVSAVLGCPHVLYKEKLNIKPASGNGFAPHLDAPSLRIAMGKDEKGPQNFVTVMVAIDDHTVTNGCLRVCKGPWTQETAVTVVEPEQNGNPDAGGRAGAIPLEIANNLDYEDVVCKGGTIAAFGGFVPHRSAVNQSVFARRGVFLTYNPASEGDFHTQYYEKMDRLRRGWRRRVGLLTADEKSELDALATVPEI